MWKARTAADRVRFWFAAVTMVLRSSSVNSTPPTFNASVSIASEIVCAPASCILPHRIPGTSVALNAVPEKYVINLRRLWSTLTFLFFIKMPPSRTRFRILDQMEDREQPRLQVLSVWGFFHLAIGHANIGQPNLTVFNPTILIWTASIDVIQLKNFGLNSVKLGCPIIHMSNDVSGQAETSHFVTLKAPADAKAEDPGSDDRRCG